MNPSGSSKKNLDGVTDTSVEASYSWTVGQNDVTGRYKVDVQVAASGYGNETASKSSKVTSIPVSSSSGITTIITTLVTVIPIIIITTMIIIISLQS